MKRHELLSRALYETVEFGKPMKIRMGDEDFADLCASLDALNAHKLLVGPYRFEGVRVSVEPSFKGCIVEHDARHFMPDPIDGCRAVPLAAVRVKDSRASAIKAW